MLYTVFLFLHITGALVLFIAVGIEWLCLSNLRKAETRKDILAWLKNISVLKKIFPVGTLLLLISGIYMMAELWRDAAFAILGIIGLTALAISGSVLSRKKLMAVGASAAQTNNESTLSEVLNKARDEYIWNSFLMRGGAGVGIIFIMTVKTNLLDSIIALAVSTLLGYLTGKLTKAPEVMPKGEIKEETILSNE